MNTLIITICIIGFIFSTLLSLFKNHIKVVNNVSLGIVSNIEDKSTIKNNKFRYSYIVTVDNVHYKLKTSKDSSGLIKVGDRARLLTVSSGRKFINFNNADKSFYVFNYKDLNR